MAAAQELSFTLEPSVAAKCSLLLNELEIWSQRYNLTAIRTREKMLTHHLFDSWSVHSLLHGKLIADIGTGAGFPGLPLALLNPQREFTLIDSSLKKLRFVEHAVQVLGISNVSTLHTRVEHFAPSTFFDTLVVRAFAALPTIATQVAGLCQPQTQVLAMKGKHPDAEIQQLPRGWRVKESRSLQVPGLAEARCVVMLQRSHE